MTGSPRPRAVRPIARGDLVLVVFPFTDLSTAKRRPAVVVRTDPIDVVLAFVSSQHVGTAETGAVTVLPTHPEFSLTGLTAPSRIRAARLVTLSRTLLRRWLGRLGPLLTADLDRALVAALGVNMVPYREEGRREERARLSALYGAGGSGAVLADLGVSARGG